MPSTIPDLSTVTGRLLDRRRFGGRRRRAGLGKDRRGARRRATPGGRRFRWPHTVRPRPGIVEARRLTLRAGRFRGLVMRLRRQALCRLRLRALALLAGGRCEQQVAAARRFRSRRRCRSFRLRRRFGARPLARGGLALPRRQTRGRWWLGFRRRCRERLGHWRARHREARQHGPDPNLGRRGRSGQPAGDALQFHDHDVKAGQ
ncbi:hypothetical protein ACVW0J_008057 [Bradyrhizobium sp. i1.7.7]